MDNGNMTSASGEAFEKREIFFIFILLFLCYLLFFFHLDARPLWDGDEGMHAATSKDMVLSGDWITPTFNGEKFYDKPVLYNWFVSLSFLVFGFTEFAARLPSAILGTGCVLVVYVLGRTLFGPMVGLLGGVILATSGEQLILSRAVVHDIALAFFITLSLFFFYRGFKKGGDRKRDILLFYVSSGFAVLAKGPVGILLPLLIIGLFLLLEKRLSFLRELWSLWGILLFFAIAAPWYVLISFRNRDYISYFILHQNVMRFLSSKAIHQEPFYYYFPVLMGGFLPWSFFLPVAILRALRGPFKGRDERIVFLVLWVLVIFLFFSAASSKLPTYLLPSFPAISLLVGILWHDLLKTRESKLLRGFFYSFLTFLGILLVILIYFGVIPPKDFESEYGLDLLQIQSIVLLPLIGVALSFFLFLRRRIKASFFALAGMVVSVILFLDLMIVPSVDPYRSTKRLAQKLDGMLAPGEKLVFARVMRDSALFYTHRRALILNTRKELMNLLGSNERVFCIIKRNLFERDEKFGQMAYVIDQEGHKVIISNRK
ncbi:MAG TPA: glycosyltransferase family 39 protein [Thermodesulfobacteriota bacterium]|nr:glycosyltransferase family 39 protein [Thermodesulfobacteriota bacterium]